MRLTNNQANDIFIHPQRIHRTYLESTDLLIVSLSNAPDFDISSEITEPSEEEQLREGVPVHLVHVMSPELK